MFQSIAEVVKDMNFFARMGMNLLAKQSDEQPLVAMTAKEFMFGYESPLVKLGNKFLPSWISFDKLGLIDRVSVFFFPTASTIVLWINFMDYAGKVRLYEHKL